MQKIDEAAIMWNKTKDPKYKDLWYKGVKELANGIRYHRFERRAISFSKIREERD